MLIETVAHSEVREGGLMLTEALLEREHRSDRSGGSTWCRWLPILLSAVLWLGACGGGAGDPDVAPTIMSQPTDQTVVAGSAATFTVAAAGTEPIAYQWQSSSDGTSFVAIAGATASSYQIAVATAARHGWRYRVVVSNGAGSVTSSAATLNVAITPVIMAQPADQSVVAGADARFSVTAGGNVLNYQWQSSSDGSTFTSIAGATADSLSLATTTLLQDGNRYRVVVSNAAGTVASDTAALSVSPSTAGLTCTGTGGTGWCAVSSRPATGTLNAVAKVDASTLVAVGDGGVILRSSDGGVSWNAVSSGTNQTLRAVAFAGPAVGLAVGSGGTVLRSTDTGQSWTSVTTPAGAGAVFSSVAFASPAVGVLTNWNQSSDAAGIMLRTQDGGQSWSSATIPVINPGCTVAPCPYYRLRAVAFANSLQGIAINNGSMTPSVLRTTDAGNTWTQVSSPSFSHIDIGFATPEVGVIVGAACFSGTIYRTSNGGQTWQTIIGSGITINECYAAFNAVSFSGLELGIVVGVSGGGGTIARTSDGGISWSTIGAPFDLTIPALYEIAVVSPKTAVAVGARGTILITTSGGL